MRVKEFLLIPIIFFLGFLLVAPVPPWALDIVIAFNLGFSTLLLVSCLFTLRLSRLLIFPTLILLLTLFRIATNVATTRMILTQANAGEIINAFGKLLIAGDIVVGLVIFSLISLVSIIVITRGALRISEVAARFTLDALPARQASIEQEFRSGVISFEEAQSRRQELQRESMLYGSMEGAMKFIQGDAIISVLAVLINMGGGIFVGMRGKLTFEQAIQKYSILSVGDGLVAQIPALFLAISAGVIVSRVSSMAHDSFISQVTEQFFNRKDALAAAGLITILLGLLPGLPSYPFFLLGTLFLGSAAVNFKRHKPEHHDRVRERNMAKLIIPSNLVYSSQNHHEVLEKVRIEISNKIGFRLPALNLELSANARAPFVEVKNIRFDIPFPSNHGLLVSFPPFYHKFFKDQDYSAFKLPFLRLKGLALTKNLKNIRLAQAIGATILDPLEFIAMKAYEILVGNPDTFVDVGSTLAVTRDLVRSLPELEMILQSERFIPPTKFSELIKTLLRSKLAISDTVLLIEKIHNICLRYNQTRDDDTLNVEDLFELLISDGLYKAILPFEMVFSKTYSLCLVKDVDQEMEENLLSRKSDLTDYATVPCIAVHASTQAVDQFGLRAANYHLSSLKNQRFCTIVNARSGF